MAVTDSELSPLVPNLVIGGAPKCGTSTFFRSLTSHPDVAGSNPKETFFLMDEDNPIEGHGGSIHSDGLAGYERFFAPDAARKRLRVEGTTHYMYQQTARETLAALEPRPTIAFLLRDPARRIHSSFQYTRNNLAQVDARLTFARYVDLLLSDPEGIASHVRSRPHAYVLRRELQLSTYADHVERWLEHFEPNEIRLLLFEDMKRDPVTFLHGFARDVGLDPERFPESQQTRANRTVQVRARLLHRGARWVARRLPRGIPTRPLRDLYLRVATTPPAPMTDEDRLALRRLSSYFVDPNRRLSRLTGLDTSSWGAS